MVVAYFAFNALAGLYIWLYGRGINRSALLDEHSLPSGEIDPSVMLDCIEARDGGATRHMLPRLIPHVGGRR